MNRWHVYAMLKGEKVFNEQEIRNIEHMNITEIKEGLIEFLIMKNRDVKEN